MMKFTLKRVRLQGLASLVALLSLGTVSSGVSAQANIRGATPAKTPAAVSAGTEPRDPNADFDPAKLPRQELKPTWFFQILGAEIAGQRGQPVMAAQTFMTLARETQDPRFARRAMEMGIRAGSADLALQGARLWQQLAPEATNPKQMLLYWQLVGGRLDEAEPALLQRLQSANPAEREQLITELPQVLSRGNDRTAAYAFLNRILSADPQWTQRASTQIALAKSAFMGNALPQAEQHLQRALVLQPDSTEAVLGLAQVLNQRQDKAPLITLLQNFVQQNPKNREVRQHLAQLYQQNGQLQEAGKEVEVMLQQAPQDPSLLLAMARFSMQNNQGANAEKYLLRYLATLDKPAARPRSASGKGADSKSADPKDAANQTAVDADEVEGIEVEDGNVAAAGDKPDAETANGKVVNNPREAVYLALGQLAEERRAWADALNWYGKIKTENVPVDVYTTALIRRASVLQKQGQLAQARQLLHTRFDADKAGGEQAQIRLALAEAGLLRDARQERASHQVLQQTASRFPQAPDVLYEYALSLEKQNDLVGMEETLRRVMALRPKDALAYNALGYSLADRNVRLSEALELIEKAMALQPNDAMIIDSLGWVHFRLGNLEKAIGYLQQAYRLRPEVDIGAHLGEALWRNGQQEAAKQVWRESRQREPENTVLRDTLSRLGVSL
jgi:tetratricopeptide (TPR) repeat protein